MKLLDILKQRAININQRTVWEDDINGTISFFDMDNLSAKIYHYLIKHNIGKEDIVAIQCKRGIHIPVIMLGVWKAGAAFTCLGEQSPKENIEFILNDTNPKLIFTEETYIDAMKYEPLEGYVQADIHDLACIVYSSGSTGRFKGSMHEYGQIENAIETSSAEIYKVDVLLNGIDIYRDAFIYGFYSVSAIVMLIDSIVNEMYEYVVSYENIGTTKQMESVINNKKLNTLGLSPNMVKELHKMNVPTLTYIGFNSEISACEPIEGYTCTNVYGMSESLRTLTCFVVDKYHDIIPIGKPIGNNEIKLIDENGREVEKGQIGEIIYKNEYFRGYRNLPALTKEKFINKWLHTSDMAYVNENDDIVVVGRKIDVVKSNEGYIVPVFVRNAVLKHFKDITEAYVRVFEHETQYNVCLYYKSNVEHNLNEIVDKIKCEIPSYMLPIHCKKLDEMYYIFPSGKYDRLSYSEII